MVSFVLVSFVCFVWCVYLFLFCYDVFVLFLGFNCFNCCVLIDLFWVVLFSLFGCVEVGWSVCFVLLSCLFPLFCLGCFVWVWSLLFL